MPRRKPAGWPKLMTAKRLKSGVTAYYWDIPTWAKKAGCQLEAEALGTDYAAARQRSDEILNKQFDACGEVEEAPDKAPPGTFDWMVAVYKTSPKYTERPAKTRKEYDKVLKLVSVHALKDGRFGRLSLTSITPGAADRLFAKIKVKPSGGERIRTAVLAMRVCQRAWNVAWRDKPDQVPAANPFAKMDLSYTAKPTRPVTYAELLKFVDAADRAGESSLGTAAMIAYFWLQREQDILTRLSWSHYRPADAPNCARIFKTGELVDLPLFDEDDTPLWPEIMERLDEATRRGTLIVIRDKPDRRRKIYLPWKEDYFRHRVAGIRATAGIEPEAKFMGLRHGGNTEGADAGLSDAQLRALSGHRSQAALLRYAQATQEAAPDRRSQEARAKNEKGEFVGMSR